MRAAKDMGQIADLSRDEYDKLDRCNFSRLKVIARSPLHFRHEWDNPSTEDTDARKLGRATHVAIFEPLRFGQFAVFEGKKRQGKEWDEMVAKVGEQNVLTRGQWDTALAIGNAVRANPDAAKYLAKGRPEATALWTDRETGIDCKGRLDWLGTQAILDLKTCRDASLDAFGRAAWAYKYHVQAAMYVDGVEAVTGERLPYYLLAVESEAPHVVQPYRVPEHLLEQGRREYRDLLGALKVCREANFWPGYAAGEMDLQLPKWAKDYAEEGFSNGNG